MAQKEYKGAVYIAVVGGESENGECRDSIEAITRRGHDTPPQYVRATKGYEARQMHLNNWMDKTKHPFILFLDHDMIFSPDTLERLRRHKLPYVSGFYMRRRYQPIAPVWFEQNEPGHMPLKPLTQVVQRNALYPLGASGWGCILMHRDVVTATRKLLKGEDEIIEDDMDLFPYDFKKVAKSVNIIKQGLEGKKIKPEAAQKALSTLVSELRPLRGLKDPVGSDIRFPFFARMAGFDLWGDSGVVCQHVLNYPLSVNDYMQQSGEQILDIALYVAGEHAKEIQRIQKAVRV